MDYAYPGGSPGDKPYPTGANTSFCIFRAGSSAFSSSQDYQTMMIADLDGWGTCAMEVIIAGSSNPTVSIRNEIYFGGYDQVQSGAGEEYDLGLGSAQAANQWIAYAISWDGVTGHPAKMRYRRQSDSGWTTITFLSTGQYAYGNLYRMMLCWPSEQPGNVDACSMMAFQGELSEAQLNSILAAGGDIPSALVSSAIRHFPLASAATANQEMVNGAHALWGGSLPNDVAASPFPWPGLVTAPTLSAPTVVPVSSTSVRPRVTFDFP